MARINLAPPLPTPTRDWCDVKAWFCSELLLAWPETATFFRNPLVVPANVLTPADAALVASGYFDIFKRMLASETTWAR
jgi:fumarate reductase subunit C